jgi:hypothetical protein
MMLPGGVEGAFLVPRRYCFLTSFLVALGTKGVVVLLD